MIPPSAASKGATIGGLCLLGTDSHDGIPPIDGSRLVWWCDNARAISNCGARGTPGRPSSTRALKRCSSMSSSAFASCSSMILGAGLSRTWKTLLPRHDAPAYFFVTLMGSQFSLSAMYDRRVAPSGKAKRPTLKK